MNNPVVFTVVVQYSKWSPSEDCFI